MRLIGRFVLLALALFVGFVFVQRWQATRPLGYGTGFYGGKSGEDSTTTRRSRLKDVASNPANYANKRVTLTGRVRQYAKYASNRNIYTLTTPDESARVIVIDDNKPPQEYFTRTVSGTLRKIPGTDAYYLVDVDSRVRLTPPSSAQVQKLLTTKLNTARQTVGNVYDQTRNAVSNATQPQQ